MNSLTLAINTSFINRAFIKVLSMLWLWSLFKIKIRRHSFTDSTEAVSSMSINNKLFLWDNLIMGWFGFPQKNLPKNIFWVWRVNLPFLSALSILSSLILMKALVVWFSVVKKINLKMLILNSFSFLLLGHNMKHLDLTFSLTLQVSK